MRPERRRPRPREGRAPAPRPLDLPLAHGLTLRSSQYLVPWVPPDAVSQARPGRYRVPAMVRETRTSRSTMELPEPITRPRRGSHQHALPRGVPRSACGGAGPTPPRHQSGRRRVARSCSGPFTNPAHRHGRNLASQRAVHHGRSAALRRAGCPRPSGRQDAAPRPPDLDGHRLPALPCPEHGVHAVTVDDAHGTTPPHPRRGRQRCPATGRRPQRRRHAQTAGYRTALVGKAHFDPHLDLFARHGENRLASHGQHGPWHGFDHVELAGARCDRAAPLHRLAVRTSPRGHRRIRHGPHRPRRRRHRRPRSAPQPDPA